MNNISEEYIKSVIANVASHNSLCDWKYTVRNFESIGQNYFGVLIPIVLTGNRDDGETNLHMVLKLAPTDERYRVSGALTSFFSREIYFYSILLAVYNKLQSAFPRFTPFISPDCYYFCKEYCREVIAIQDMSVQGYKTYTRKFLTYEHIIVSLTELAKFHALSFILKMKYSNIYEEVVKVCQPLKEKTNKRFMNILENRLDKAMLHFKDTKYITLLNNLRNHYVNYIEMIAVAVKGTVICHGDIWKENVLYKYEDDKPVSACIIDYQTARLSSPAFDFLFLIVTSSDTTLRKEHYQDFVDIYYDMFENVLLEAGYDAKEVYSRDDFQSDLKTVAKGCFIVANTALWLASGLQEEGHVRSKVVCKNDKERQQATDSYKHIISAIIDDFIIYGYV